jgi:hypothetical protein
MVRSENPVYIFTWGMHQGVNIERVPIEYIEWFIENKSFQKLKKSDKESIIEYFRQIQGLDKIKMPEAIENTSEWHDISELPDIGSEVEVKPFTAILTFKGKYFENEKGKAVSIDLVDEWRYTDRYLEPIQ